MYDSCGRNINKLRVSLSEACDLACVYCVERIGAHKVAPDQLNTGEMLKLVRLLKENAGIEKIRITGGEPLLYRSLPEFIQGVKQIGITDIGLTSNGQHLSQKAGILKEAGLVHANISLDSLKTEKFRKIARVGNLQSTLEGIDQALQEKIRLKINMVVIRGENDDEILDVLEYGLSKGIEVRYLELMKMGPLFENYDARKLFPMKEILSTIQEQYSFQPVPVPPDSTSLRFQVEGGTFGIIANESAPFCAGCSRLRLSSNGHLIGCLSNPKAVSVRHLLHHSESSLETQLLVTHAIHYKQKVGFAGSDLRMSSIGG